MKKAELIRIFYKNNRGTLIAFRGRDFKARWYRFSYRRLEAICQLTYGWESTYTEQALTFRRGD